MHLPSSKIKGEKGKEVAQGDWYKIAQEYPRHEELGVSADLITFT